MSAGTQALDQFPQLFQTIEQVGHKLSIIWVANKIPEFSDSNRIQSLVFGAVSYIGVLGPESQLCFHFQLPGDAHAGRQQLMAPVLRSYHPCGRPRYSSYRHIEDEPEDNFSPPILPFEKVY